MNKIVRTSLAQRLSGAKTASKRATEGEGEPKGWKRSRSGRRRSKPGGGREQSEKR